MPNKDKIRLINIQKRTFTSILMTKSFVIFEFLVNSRFQRIEKEIKRNKFQ